MTSSLTLVSRRCTSGCSTRYHDLPLTEERSNAMGPKFWRRRRTAVRRVHRPQLEILEYRQLLSAGLVDVYLAGTASGNIAALEARVRGHLGSSARQRLTPDGRFVLFERPSTALVPA